MDKVKIHDNCLEYEDEIWNSVEQLGDQRIKNYETGRQEDISLIIPILNEIIDRAERYKEYIREVSRQ